MRTPFAAPQHKRSPSSHAERELYCAIHYDQQIRSTNNVEGKKDFKMKLWSMETAKLSMKTILDDRHRLRAKRDPFMRFRWLQILSALETGKQSPIWNSNFRFQNRETFSSLELIRDARFGGWKSWIFVLSPRRDGIWSFVPFRAVITWKIIFRTEVTVRTLIGFK